MCISQGALCCGVLSLLGLGVYVVVIVNEAALPSSRSTHLHLPHPTCNPPLPKTPNGFVQERRQEKAAERERKQEERQRRLEQLEKQLQGLEQAAADGAPADDRQDGDQDGDQAKATGDGAVTPGARSAPDDEEDDHADHEGVCMQGLAVQLCIQICPCPDYNG